MRNMFIVGFETGFPVINTAAFAGLNPSFFKFHMASLHNQLFLPLQKTMEL
jgi:hypothetical protein